MSTPTPILRGDLTTTAFGAAPTWTDYSQYLELGANGQPIEITWGRQDERSEVSPSTFSFMLSNNDGRFTTGASIITTAHQFNVRETVGGTTYDRCTGYVESVETLWPGGVQNFSVVKVNCVDVSSRLDEAQPLRSLYEQELLAESPNHLWTLAESAGVSSAGNLVNAGAVLNRLDSIYGAGTLEFGSSMGRMIDDVTGVNFGTTWSTTAALSTPQGSVLSTRSVPLIPDVGTVEMWVVMPTSAPLSASYQRGIIFYQGDGSTQSLEISVNAISGILQVWRDGFASSYSVNVCDGRAHLITWSLNAGSAELFYDGQSVLTGPVSLAPTLSSPYTQVGGLLIDNGGGYAFPGTVAEVSILPGTTTAAEALARYQAGVGTGPAERSDQRFARILGYAGLTSTALPTGIATMGGQKTAGKTVRAALQEVTDTEGGDMYVTPAGQFTFQTRAARYNPTSSFTLTADDIGADIVVRKDRQGLVNDQTVSRDAGATQRVQNASSISTYGRRDGGTFEVAASTDEDAYQNAAWRVATSKDPRLRLSSLPLDLRAAPTTSLVQSIMGATVGTAITAASLPTQTPGGTSMSMFIEGANEQIGAQGWSIEFFTSPVTNVQSSVMVLDSVTSGVLNTNVLGF